MKINNQENINNISTSKILREKKKSHKNPDLNNKTKIPYPKQIFEYLKKIDKQCMFDLNINPACYLFFLRSKMINKILKRQKRFNMDIQTFIISIYLLDLYINKNLDEFILLNSNFLSDNENLTNSTQIPLTIIKKNTNKKNPLIKKLKIISFACFFLACKLNEISWPTIIDIFFPKEPEMEKFLISEKIILDIINFHILTPPYMSYTNFIVEDIFNGNQFYYKTFIGILKKAIFSNCIFRFNPRYIVFCIFLRIIKKYHRQYFEKFQGLLGFMDLNEKVLETVYKNFSNVLHKNYKYFSICLN